MVFLAILYGVGLYYYLCLKCVWRGYEDVREGDGISYTLIYMRWGDVSNLRALIYISFYGGL